MRKYKNVAIKELKPYKNNARTHSNEQIDKIVKSIEEFGFINPVLIDGDFGIIAGHGRVLAAQSMGMKEVPCLFIEDLTEAQKRAYIIADNKLALDAGWDEEILKMELGELKALDFDVSLTGFELSDFNLDDSDGLLEDDFDTEAELPEEAKSKLGEVYQLGNHRLMCGDATKQADVEKLVGSALIDLFVTDPPYNVDYEGSSGLTIQNDNMSSEKFEPFLYQAFSQADGVMTPGAAFYIWFGSGETISFYNACKNNDWEVRQQLIWVKNAFVLGRQDYQWKHEGCIYGWKDGAAHYFTDNRTNDSEDGYVTVDSMEQEAYKDTKSNLRNSRMDGKFPTLQPGVNTITWTVDVTAAPPSELKKIKIEPKSRWL